MVEYHLAMVKMAVRFRYAAPSNGQGFGVWLALKEGDLFDIGYCRGH